MAAGDDGMGGNSEPSNGPDASWDGADGWENALRARGVAAEAVEGDGVNPAISPSEQVRSTERGRMGAAAEYGGTGGGEAEQSWMDGSWAGDGDGGSGVSKLWTVMAVVADGGLNPWLSPWAEQVRSTGRGRMDAAAEDGESRGGEAEQYWRGTGGGDGRSGSADWLRKATVEASLGDGRNAAGNRAAEQGGGGGAGGGWV